MSAEEILRLERLSHAAKMAHWSEKEPWKQLRLPRDVARVKAGRIFLDTDGNITKMPLLIGRPCFGQVTAVLRHGGHQPFWNPRTRTWMHSRCMRCPIRDACEYVVDERLRVTPQIDQVHREWKLMGGREATWKITGRTQAKNCYRDLLHLLKTTLQFTSCNDASVLAHYENVVEQRRERDRKRKQRDRARQSLQKAQAGQITSDVEQVLRGHRAWRAVEHLRACRHADAPKCLRNLPIETSRFDASVWTAYQRVILRKDEPNPYSCSVELHRMGVETHRSINALRDRVKRSLERLHVLERLRLDDASRPVWPRFTSKDLTEGLQFIPLRA